MQNARILKLNIDDYYKVKRIPVWAFDQNYNLIYTNFTTSAILNLMESMKKKAKRFRLSHSIDGYYLDTDSAYEMYYIFNYDIGKHQFYTGIIGPVMSLKPSGDMWHDLSFGENLFIEQKRILANALPVITKDEFMMEITVFLKDILEITPPEFLNINEFAGLGTGIDDIDTGDDLSCYEKLCDLEDMYSIYIVNGSVYKLYSIFDNEESMDILFPNKASYKDCIVRALELLTIAKVSSIENGTDKRLCQSIFYKYTEQLKACKTYEKILSVLTKGTLEFTKSSHDISSHTSENYSPMTNKCIKRIIEKLPDKISLDGLAGDLHISPKYLSALFNKEVGMSITDFMQNMRINEAKRLLTGTELSYLEISNLLNFCSQSYFNNLFKKKEGMTPKEYRENYNTELQRSSV